MGQLSTGACIRFDGIADERHVQSYATIVNLLVMGVFFPYSIKHGKLGKALLDREFRLNVAAIVCFERFPFVGGVFGSVTHPLTVCGGGFTG